MSHRNDNIGRYGLLVLLLGLSSLHATDNPNHYYGNPLVIQYTPTDYGEVDHITDIIEGSEGLMYFANETGILEFDGVSWRNITINPEDKAFKFLDLGADASIRVGLENDFGVLRPNAVGEWEYASLDENFSAQQSVSNGAFKVFTHRNSIFLRGFSRLIQWDKPGEWESWETRSSHYGLFILADNLYLGDDERGLLQLVDNTLIPVPGGAYFRDRAKVIYATKIGNDLSTRAIIATLASGLFQFDGKTIAPFHTEVDELVKNSEIVDIAVTANGNLVILTRDFGIIVIDSEGRLVRIIDHQLSGINATLRTIAVASDQTIWLGGDGVIAHLSLFEPYTYFNELPPLGPRNPAIIEFADDVYFATIGGVYKTVIDRQKRSIEVKIIEGTQGTINAVLPTGAGLLYSTKKGLYYRVRGKNTIFWKNERVDGLIHSKINLDYVYVALRNGVGRLELIDGQWQNPQVICKLERLFRGQIHRFAEDQHGLLWARSAKGDNMVIKIDPRGSEAVVEYIDWNPVHPKKPLFCEFDKQHYFFNRSNFWKYDPASNSIPRDLHLSKVFEKTGGISYWSTCKDKDGNYWFGGPEGSGVIYENAGEYSVDFKKLKFMHNRKIEDLVTFDSEVIWINGRQVVVRYDTTLEEESVNTVNTVIRRMFQLNDQATLYGGHGFEQTVDPVAYVNNNLGFQFATLSYPFNWKMKHQFYLEGFDATWSKWDEVTAKEYTNLREGSYTFHVRGMDRYGKVGNTASYSFEIAPPYYRTAWAYAFYLFFSVFLLYGFAYLRSRHVEKLNRELQIIITERTRQIRAQNEELAAQSEELKAQNDALNQQNDELDKLNREKNEFIGIASHDLKNPLAAITVLSELITRDSSSMEPEEIHEHAEDIHKSSQLMTEIVSNILDINRIEEGQLIAKKMQCDLVETVALTCRNYQQRAGKKGIVLQYIPEVEKAEIMGDASLLTQIADNLVSNAIKYSPMHTTVEVRVGTRDIKNYIAVKDEGPGISGEDQDKLFQKFARLSAQPTGGENSTGLGLAIVKRMVEAMEGTVYCKSELGAGACFVVEFPLHSSSA